MDLASSNIIVTKIELGDSEDVDAFLPTVSSNYECLEVPIQTN